MCKKPELKSCDNMATSAWASVKLLLPMLAASRPPRSVFCCRCSSSPSSSSSSASAASKFETSDVLQLAEKARITLTPKEVEDFRPKLEQLVGWFAQLQEVDLDNITPALRADNLGELPLREDIPSPFEDRDGILAAVPEKEGPYVKVPKILNENME